MGLHEKPRTSRTATESQLQENPMKKILTYSLNLKQIFPKIGFCQFLKNKNFHPPAKESEKSYVEIWRRPLIRQTDNTRF